MTSGSGDDFFERRVISWWVAPMCLPRSARIQVGARIETAAKVCIVGCAVWQGGHYVESSPPTATIQTERPVGCFRRTFHRGAVRLRCSARIFYGLLAKWSLSGDFAIFERAAGEVPAVFHQLEQSFDSEAKQDAVFSVTKVQRETPRESRLRTMEPSFASARA